MELSPEERARWNDHASSQIRPKYQTERSKTRIEKGIDIMKMTADGCSIREIKESVGSGYENIATFRRRVVHGSN